MEPDAAEYFQGHPGRECGDHRTVGGHRAWCYDCGEWCYPQIPCVRCEVPRLRAEIATLRAGLASPSEEVVAENKRLRAVLREVLDDYAFHLRGCPGKPGMENSGPCDCGLDELAALAALRTTKEGNGV